MSKSQIIPAIMCGGSGERLWPLSRKQLPKPFVELPGGGSLLQKTFERLEHTGCPQVIVVCAADHIDAVRLAHKRSGLESRLAIIAEPIAKNTAPACASVARFVAQHHAQDAVVALLPADHILGEHKKFWQAIEQAAAAAKAGKLATLGIKPDHPSTNYGYIIAGANTETGLCEVVQFAEKPNEAKAKQLIDAGNCYWNSGVFVATAETILTELAEHAPQIAVIADKFSLPSSEALWTPEKEIYERFESISIDHAIAEKTSNAAVVTDVDVGWSDAGIWDVFAKQAHPDDSNNRSVGRAEFADSENCATYSTSDRLIAVAGMTDTVVVDTADAILVAKAGSADEVRKIYEKLAGEKDQCALSPAAEHRPWGSYQVLAAGPGFKLKRIEVNPGAQLSLQSHKHRSEHWTTADGVMTITVDDKTFEQPRDRSCYIPQGAKHRMANRTSEPAAVIELQLGSYLGEDDIQRYEDDYERA